MGGLAGSSPRPWVRETSSPSRSRCSRSAALSPMLASPHLRSRAQSTAFCWTTHRVTGPGRGASDDGWTANDESATSMRKRGPKRPCNRNREKKFLCRRVLRRKANRGLPLRTRESDLFRAHRDVADKHPSRYGCCTGPTGSSCQAATLSCPNQADRTKAPNPKRKGVFLPIHPASPPTLKG